jgi:hypothetical protein
MNKVIFSDFTLQNSQLFKGRYMSSIWVRTKSYLWGNNGEQPEVTWPEETLSGTGSMRMRNRKFAMPLVEPFHRIWPEVIVCATGTFCITTRVVLQVPWLHVTEVHPKGWKGPFYRKLATGSEVIFPRAFFLVVQNVGWVFSTTSASTPFPGYLPLLFS